MKYIVGIDEAGRGAWAGPLVVGSVILGEYNLKELTDSKLLNKKSRKQLADLIYENSVSATVGWVSPEEVDTLGLTRATTLAIKRSLKTVDYSRCEMIIDGNINYFNEYKNSKCMIKADLKVPAVSAASIIAKVARDEYMAKASDEYPNHGFDQHVGYGTKNHRLAIANFGVTKLHRLSYKPLSIYGRS